MLRRRFNFNDLFSDFDSLFGDLVHIDQSSYSKR